MMLYLLIGFFLSLRDSYSSYKRGQRDISFYLLNTVVLSVIWGPLWLISWLKTKYDFKK